MRTKRKKSNISIVIPAFNEEKNLDNVVAKISSIAPKYTNKYEIIIVNDGSIDRTGAIAKKISRKNKNVRLIENKENKGLGFSFLRGARDARYEYVMLHFGDDDCPPASLSAVLSQLGKADIVIAYYTNFHLTKSWFRHILSISYTHLINYITGYTLHYYNGMSIHKTEHIKKMKDISPGLEAQAHMILNSLDKGVSFIEVAVINQERTEGVSSALRINSIINVVSWVLKAYLNHHVRGRGKKIKKLEDEGAKNIISEKGKSF